MEPSLARHVDSTALPGDMDSSLARVFAHARVDGLEHLQGLSGPVVFASNHQSHMDVPVILSALPGRWRARVAPAMAKEFFKAHFFPAGYTWRERFTNGLNYYLAAFYFNAFPLPQREAGARQTLQYIGELTGEGWSILIFPEGLRSSTGDIKPFRGGIGMIGSRLDIPDRSGAHRRRRQTAAGGRMFIRPGRVRVAFGAPLRLQGRTTRSWRLKWSGRFARSESPSTARVLTRSSTFNR